MSFFNEDAANLAQLISLSLEATGFLMTLMEIYRPMLADKIENKIDWLADISKHFQSIDNFIENIKQSISVVNFDEIYEHINKIKKQENNILVVEEQEKTTFERTDTTIALTSEDKAIVEETLKMFEEKKTIVEQNKKVLDLNKEVIDIMSKVSFIQYILFPLIIFFIVYIVRHISSSILSEETISQNIKLFYIITIPLSLLSMIKIAPFTEGLIYKAVYLVHIIISFLNQLTNGKALGAIGVILGGIGLLGEIYQVLVILLNK